MSSRRRALALAIIPAVAAAVAGCGSNGPSNTASVGSGSGQTSNAAPFKYAACMRTHGVTNFPEPQVTHNGGATGIRMAVPASIGQTPAFKSAQKACQGILPAPSANGPNSDDSAAHKADLLSFARCMRSHGITSFPDPDSQGQIQPQTLQSAHVDLQSQVVQKAAYTCVPASHGAVNAAAIHGAVSGGG